MSSDYDEDETDFTTEEEDTEDESEYSTARDRTDSSEESETLVDQETEEEEGEIDDYVQSSPEEVNLWKKRKKRNDKRKSVDFSPDDEEGEYDYTSDDESEHEIEFSKKPRKKKGNRKKQQMKGKKYSTGEDNSGGSSSGEANPKAVQLDLDEYYETDYLPQRMIEMERNRVVEIVIFVVLGIVGCVFFILCFLGIPSLIVIIIIFEPWFRSTDLL